MFRQFFFIIASLVATASAFSTGGTSALKNKVKPTFINMAVAKMKSFESEIGAQAPLGFWDPLGLLKNADEDRFARLRSVEVKHGRVAMLAILGHLVTTAGVRLPTSLTPGYDLSTVPTGLAALTTTPGFAIPATVLFVGAIEFGFAARKDDIEAAQKTASGWDNKTWDKKNAIELNNGRAAQMGILALMVHEKIDNNPYIINSLFGQPVLFNNQF